VLPADDEELLELAGLSDALPPEQGLFRDGCWLRKVSAEPALLFGGGRALLLEISHPLMAAGVAEHSDFRRDPFGRLQRTLDAMTAIAFGHRASALAAARGVDRAHAHFTGALENGAGRFPAGTRYAGRDPDLMLWVWATLVDTALVVYQRFVALLDAAALDAYLAEQSVVARVLGIPASRVPASHADFRRYFDAMLEGDTLCVTPTAREIADAVLAAPGRLAGASQLRSLTAALLPARLREAFGLSWDETRAQRIEALTASVRALRRDGPDAA
jgi:uncharacterized protein (DUF2236 family)